MATSPLLQLDVNSVDTEGISVATTPASAGDARKGSAYDPVVFSAAAPVWLHPLYNGQWLMASTQRWYAATPVGGTPGAYSAYTVDSVPNWVVILPFSGSSATPPGHSIDIPMNTAATGVTLVGGASRPNNLLFLLSAATVAGQATAVLQRFHLDINRAITIAAEDVLPVTQGVTFNKGVQYASPNLIVYGTDATNRIYQAIKPWAHVGTNSISSPHIPKFTVPNTIGSPQGWQYYTGTGFSLDPTELAPLKAADGTTMTTRGPMSFASWRNQSFMTTVNLSGTTYTGQIWVSRSGLPPVPYGSPVALGSSSDGSYLGGGIQLMAQLAANPAAPGLSAPGVVSGIPYVTWTKTAPSGGHTLNTQWSIVPVKA